MTPRWVKVSGILIATAIVVFLLALAFGGGEHNPLRHLGAAAATW